jgi:ribosomal protein L11 methyltransferase
LIRRAWIEVSFEVPAAYQDLLVGQLATFGFQGFLQEEDLLLCYLPSGSWKNDLKVKLRACLRNFKMEFGRLDLSWRTKTIGEKNWNETWEKSVNIVEVTPRIIIKPSWKKLRQRDRGKMVLHIDPKMAFGTGHHETTRLALTLIEDHLRPGDKVLDVGCGTGILAVAAVKLGAHSALAIDNDPAAVENAVENIRRNKVSRRVKALRGDATRLPKRTFDMIAANIDLATITNVLKHVIKRLDPQGRLIVSGLLVSDLSTFMDLITHQGILPLEMISENEWVAIALTRAYALDNN